MKSGRNFETGKTSIITIQTIFNKKVMYMLKRLIKIV